MIYPEDVCDGYFCIRTLITLIVIALYSVVFGYIGYYTYIAHIELKRLQNEHRLLPQYLVLSSGTAGNQNNQH